MSGKIEAWIYGTAEAQFADAVSITVTEPGPTTYVARLLAPARLSDALTAWAAALNGSALAGTYALAWDATAQAVTISATGVASFEVVFGGNLAAALGFASSTGHTGAASYTGTVQALTRYDAIVSGSPGVMVRDDVKLAEYSHGRHRAIAWASVDLLELQIYMPAARLDSLLRSYCAAGLVRVWQSATAHPYGVDYVDGYVDGAVVELQRPRHRGGSGLSTVTLVVARGR
jgi:hypothetical protein